MKHQHFSHVSSCTRPTCPPGTPPLPGFLLNAEDSPSRFPFPFPKCQPLRRGRESSGPSSTRLYSRAEPTLGTWTSWGSREEKHGGVEGKAYLPLCPAPKGSVLLHSIGASSFPGSLTHCFLAKLPPNIHTANSPKTPGLGDWDKGNPNFRTKQETDRSLMTKARLLFYRTAPANMIVLCFLA